LVAARNDQPFYRHEFIRIWSEHFAPDASLPDHHLAQRGWPAGRGSAAHAAAGPDVRVPVQQLESTSNEHSGRFDLIAEEDEAVAGRRIFSYLAGGPLLTAKAMAWFWDCYPPDRRKRADITASPLRASLEQLTDLAPALEGDR
jgi:hypothetical protein